MKVKQHKSGGVTVSARAIIKHDSKSDKALEPHPDISPISPASSKPAEFSLKYD